MRIERLVPCPPEELWRALIQNAELGREGAMLRLALPGGPSETAGKITVYESPRVLECVWGADVVRWELHAQGCMTRLVFTHAECCAQWLACIENIEALATRTAEPVLDE
jgi:uncharacterized protein YndB with AHSA1/START domain